MTPPISFLAVIVLLAQPISAARLDDSSDSSDTSDLTEQGTGDGSGFTGNWGTARVPFVRKSRKSAYPNVVPETSAAILGAIGALLLLRRKR